MLVKIDEWLEERRDLIRVMLSDSSPKNKCHGKDMLVEMEMSSCADETIHVKKSVDLNSMFDDIPVNLMGTPE